MKKFILLLILPLGFFFISNAQWNSTNMPGSESIRCLAIDGENIFAGIGAEGIFVSTNNGNHWTNLNTGLALKSISSLSISNGRIFASTNKGIFSSSDDGKSWMELYQASADTFILSVTSNGSNIFVGTNVGLLISVDNGYTWTRKINEFKGLGVRCVAITGDKIFAGQAVHGEDRDGIFLSTDNGETWTPVNSGLTNRVVLSLAARDSVVFAGTLGGVYVSTNNGEKWKWSSAGVADTNIQKIIICNNDIYLGTLRNGIFLSKDKGKSWSPVNNGITEMFIRSFACHGNKVYAGTDKGIFLTSNQGISWKDINYGLGSNNVNDIILINGKFFSSTNKNGLFSSTDDGNIWFRANSNITNNYIHEFIFNGKELFAISYSFRNLFLSNDYGDSWTKVHGYVPGDTIYDINDKLFQIALNGNNMYASTTFGIYFSSDNGYNWTKIFASEKWIDIDIVLKNNIVNCFAFTENKIIAGTNNGVFLSIDNGESWSESDTNLRNIKFLNFTKNNNSIFAGTNKGIFLSSDYGESWDLLNLLPNDSLETHITSLAIIDNNIFAVRKNQFGHYTCDIFLSTDNGETWNDVSSGLTTKYLKKLLLNNDKIFLGTSDNIFKAKLSDFGITDIDETDNKKNNYLYCFPPYPIPATNIVRSMIYWDTSLDIENDDIAVYDIFGNKVAGKERITIDKQNAYSGILTWDSSNVLDGIYLIRIIHGTKTWTMKVIVSK